MALSPNSVDKRLSFEEKGQTLKLSYSQAKQIVGIDLFHL
jgi:hypothetical protein